MSQATFDTTLLAQLSNLKDVTAVRDEKGELLGHYVPVGQSLIVLPPEDHCPHSPEELSRLQNQTGGMTLAEFWKKLGVK